MTRKCGQLYIHVQIIALRDIVLEFGVFCCQSIGQVILDVNSSFLDMPSDMRIDLGQVRHRGLLHLINPSICQSHTLHGVPLGIILI